MEANAVLCLDLSDVRKEYAEKMEYLDQVWDGSEGEVHAGYWLCSVTAAAYFAATFLGQKLKLKILCEILLIISQRFFGIPTFRIYALADGIKKILSGCNPTPPAEPPPKL